MYTHPLWLYPFYLDKGGFLMELKNGPKREPLFPHTLELCPLHWEIKATDYWIYKWATGSLKKKRGKINDNTCMWWEEWKHDIRVGCPSCISLLLPSFLGPAYNPVKKKSLNFTHFPNICHIYLMDNNWLDAQFLKLFMYMLMFMLWTFKKNFHFLGKPWSNFSDLNIMGHCYQWVVDKIIN